jgi:hypothetical protein
MPDTRAIRLQTLLVIGLLVGAVGCSDDDSLDIPIVTDADMAEISDDMDVESDLPEFCRTPPVSDAGAGSDVANEDTFDLEGDANDPDPDDEITAQWTQTGGPPVDIDDETSLTTSVSVNVDPEEVGESITFELEVCDECDQCDTDSVSWTIVSE